MLLERMGLSPADLTAVPQSRSKVPTFAEYVPIVSVAVSAGTRRAYGSYWNRVVEHWGGRRLDEPTPSEIQQLMAHVKTHVVARPQPAAAAQRGRNHHVGPARHGDDATRVTPRDHHPGSAVTVSRSPRRQPSAAMVARSATRPEASMRPNP